MMEAILLWAAFAFLLGALAAFFALGFYLGWGTYDR